MLKGGEGMKKDLSQKGFTLIELSIVLVIIGIILGAVLKGQDLLESAKAKKLTSAVNGWTALTWVYMDRIGTFPGDAGADGLIGNTGAEQTAAASAIGVMSAANAMANAPVNPVVIGGQSFWIYMGSDAAPTRNAMVICVTTDCTGAIGTDAMRIIQAVDTSIDGAAVAGRGQFRGATAVVLAGAGTVNTRTVAAVTNVTAVNETAGGAATAWAATQLAAVYLFDRPY